MKPHIKKGYIKYYFRVNGKLKDIFYHVIIVKMFIKSDYDSAKYDIDHMDRNKLNNSSNILNDICNENIYVVNNFKEIYDFINFDRQFKLIERDMNYE